VCINSKNNPFFSLGIGGAEDVDSPLPPESHSGSHFIGFMFFGGGCLTNRGPLPKVEKAYRCRFFGLMALLTQTLLTNF
jgi:hypothetical protein